MRKQFSQLKDFVHNNLSRNDKNEVLSPTLVKAEKHVENIKHALANSEKKISHSLLSTTASDSSSSSSAAERKLKKSSNTSLSTLFNEASESLSLSKPDSILGKTLYLCSTFHQDSIKILTEHESEVERQCIEKIQSYINNDLPNISRLRKLLNRTSSELNTLQTKYDSTLKSVQNSQIAVESTNSKLEALRSEVEDCQQRLYQCRDSYEAEILKFLSKELDISKIFSEYINLQASYHERMLKEINNCIPLIRGVLVNTTQKPVFGIPLVEHLLSTGRKISFVIEACIANLLSAKNEEGLFRVSGSLSKVKLLKNAFNAGLVDSIDSNYDVHTVASTLKSYLRELPEPLLTFDLCNDWISAASEQDLQERLKALWTVCNSLPEENKDNLRYLIKFLHELTKHSQTNKMSSQNLAIAIGPSLFWAQGEAYELSMSSYSPIIIEALITYCDYFFKEDVTFEMPKSQQQDNYASDNSDPDQSVSFAQKQTVNYRKKPAPKPPSQSSPESNHLTPSSNDIGSKFYAKIGSSFRKPKQQPATTNGLQTFTDSRRVDSPPGHSSPLASIRRNNISRNDSRSNRPMSFCERPSVPPPEVPPRPSIRPAPNQSTECKVVVHNTCDIDCSHIDSESESEAENLESQQFNSAGEEPVSLLYPSLDNLELDDCDNVSVTSETKKDIPKKPPRSAASSGDYVHLITFTGSGGNQSSSSSDDGLVPKQSPKPTPRHSPKPPSEKTYL